MGCVTQKGPLLVKNTVSIKGLKMRLSLPTQETGSRPFKSYASGLTKNYVTKFSWQGILHVTGSQCNSPSAQQIVAVRANTSTIAGIFIFKQICKIDKMNFIIHFYNEQLIKYRRYWKIKKNLRFETLDTVAFRVHSLTSWKLSSSLE